MIKIRRKQASLLAIVVGVVGLLAASYYIFLFAAPNLPVVSGLTKSSIDLNTKDDATDTRDRIEIPKIGVEVPIYTGNESVLEQGVWHRKPENGDPAIGGNFVLAAHRFELGLTPAKTKQKSPFYNIDKLQVGDEFKVYYQNAWYTYVVSKKYSVPPSALYIENKSNEPKLTLYSCTLKGANDGRDVIEATPKQ